MVSSVIDSSTVAAVKQANAMQLGPRHGNVRVVVHVRFFGSTLDGTPVESDEFEFPVDICQGCLIQFSPADIDPRLPAPNCAGNPAAAGSPVQAAVPCVPGQDLPVDCSQCPSVPDCHG
jgi:hypothetical protein